MIQRNTAICLFSLTIVGLLFFAPLLVAPGSILYSDHSDMLAMHLPMKHFSVESFQQHGELPLWCPYSFGGMPFVHDVQVAAFYPPHWLLYWLPTSWLGAAMSWLIVLHVIAGGCAMFAYARSTGLSALGSCAAGIVWMLSGKWLLHMLAGGHYIMTPLAWLPLVVMFLIRSAESSSRVRHAIWVRLGWAIAAGVVFGVMTLGTHPQVTFYSGIGVALLLLVRVKFTRSEHHESVWQQLSNVVGSGIVCAIIAIGLASIQLLPAVEATPQTTRSAGVETGDVLAGGMRTLVNFFGPAIVSPNPSCQWEDRGGFALTITVLAIFAGWVREDRASRAHAWTTIALLLFALGGAVLFQSLPGFRLFRQPTRMLLIAWLPIAWLVGAAVETFESPSAAKYTNRFRQIAIRVAAVALILVGGLAVRSAVGGDELLFQPYWAIAVVALLGICSVVSWFCPVNRRWGAIGIVALVGVDVAAVSQPYVETRSYAEIYPTGDIVTKLTENVAPGDRVLDRDDNRLSSPLGTGAPLGLLHSLEVVRGYNSFDVASYREYLKDISNDPAPLKPFDDVWTFPLVGNFPLANEDLVNLLGARYLIVPKVEVANGVWKRTGVSERQPRGYNLIAGGMQTMDEFELVENESAFPRAFLVPNDLTSVSADHLQLDEVLRRGATAVLPTEIVEWRPNAIRVKASTETISHLVLTETHYPGWHCRVDGQPTDILRVHGLFRAVSLPPGEHEIEFLFAPRSLRIGRAASLVTLGSAVLLLWGSLVVARQKTATADDNDTENGDPEDNDVVSETADIDLITATTAQ